MTETDESRDDQIYRMRLLGSSPSTIADHFSISVADVDAAAEAKMVKIDNAFRLRAMIVDLERLELMLRRFLGDALSGDLAAGHLCLKIAERKSAMLGTDAPMHVDAVQLTRVVGPQETSTERIERVLSQFVEDRASNQNPTTMGQDNQPAAQ